MFLKEFEIRWNDLDANRHLANITYLSYASETRMAFLQHIGLSHKDLQNKGIGPIVFNEELFYFKEVMPDDKIRVSFELAGMSEEGTFFSFEHNFFNQEGQNVARCEMMGAWMNLKTRKLCVLPQDIISQFEASNKTLSFKKLTASDTRKHGKTPKDLK
jgi:acyl-CoA thioester hydrolase